MQQFLSEEKSVETRAWPTIDIDKKDYEILLRINKTLEYGHKVRLIFNPAPTRNNPKAVPTKVTLICDEICFAEYILYELNKERQKAAGPAAEMRQAIG